MAWFDNLLNHFAHYPAHLFALLFVLALSKSTVLISSVLPPASVMLLTGITVSQASLHPALTWLAVVMGATLGSLLNYHIGQLMGHTRLVTRITSKHADTFLRVQHQLQKNGVLVFRGEYFLNEQGLPTPKSTAVFNMFKYLAHELSEKYRLQD